MLNLLRRIISDRSPIRLFYHKMKSVLACIRYGFPGNKLIVVGVTGTNGKTTTVTLIRDVLKEAGLKVGVSCSIYEELDSVHIPRNKSGNAPPTVLPPFKLQRTLKDMVDIGCQVVVLEVTSHSLTQNRVWGINFDVAVLTNISKDHWLYHGGEENYVNAKAELFKNLNGQKRKPNQKKFMVLNQDDKRFDFFNKFTADRTISYGLDGGIVSAKNVQLNASGSKFELGFPNESVEVDWKLPGDYNVYNALAAASVGLALDVDINTIKSGLEKSETIPGRAEPVDAGQDFQVIVDYAHSPDALEKLLRLYKGLTKGKLFIIFGSTGGGRDREKRPEMGQIVDKYADEIIVTNDDPYMEDQWSIVEEICDGIDRVEGKGLWKIPTRREAIRMAVDFAEAGDTVLLCGKGSETRIVIGKNDIEWSDKEVATELIGRSRLIDINEEK